MTTKLLNRPEPLDLLHLHPGNLGQLSLNKGEPSSWLLTVGRWGELGRLTIAIPLPKARKAQLPLLSHENSTCSLGAGTDSELIPSGSQNQRTKEGGKDREGNRRSAAGENWSPWPAPCPMLPTSKQCTCPVNQGGPPGFTEPAAEALMVRGGSGPCRAVSVKQVVSSLPAQGPELASPLLGVLLLFCVPGTH